MPRQIAMFLMREETDVSLLRIGAELGGRDHSTVLHACDKINREMQVNDEMRREVAAVRELIYTRLSRRASLVARRSSCLAHAVRPCSRRGGRPASADATVVRLATHAVPRAPVDRAARQPRGMAARQQPVDWGRNRGQTGGQPAPPAWTAGSDLGDGIVERIGLGGTRLWTRPRESCPDPSTVRAPVASPATRRSRSTARAGRSTGAEPHDRASTVHHIHGMMTVMTG